MKNNLSGIFLAALITFFGLSCSSTKKIEDLTEDDIIISFNKGPCFGQCPVYTLEIYSNNYAKLTGKRYHKKLGVWAKMLDKEQVKLLTDKFKEIDFMSMQEEYPSNIPDLPTISISYKPKKEMKTVKGKLERPKPLMDLQFLLERFIEGAGWEQIENPAPSEEAADPEVPSIIYNEIIIEPAAGVRLPLWFDGYKKYGVRLIKKIAPNQNLWLITYDQRVIQPKEMLDTLKKDKEIKSAEFNKTVTTRGKMPE